MKKLSRLYTKGILVFMLLVLLAPPANAFTPPSDTDQSCSVAAKGENYDSIGGTGMLEQSFIPTQNRLEIVTLQLYAIPDAPVVNNDIIVSIVDGDEPLISKSYPVLVNMRGQMTYVSVNFFEVNNTHVKLTKGHRYKIRLTINGYGVSWFKEGGGNCYANGTALTNTIIQEDYDYGFSTYGHTAEDPPAPTVTPTAPGTPGTTTTPTTPTTSTGTTKTAAAKVSTAPVPAAAAPIDATIGKPVLLRYDKGGTSFSAPFETEVSLKDNEQIDIVGTSFPGATVTVFIGERSYIADVVANGDWAAKINTADLGAGTYTISAQAQKGEAGSEIIDLLNIKVLGVKSEAKAEENKFFAVITNPWVIGGLALLIILLVALIVFLERKYHIFSKLFKKKDIAT